MLPKIIHQIWLGSSVPEPYQWFSEHLRELHPDWEYVLWTEENLPTLKNQSSADFFSMKMFKTDIARYEILEEHGGIYVDMDMLFYKSMDDLVERDCLIVLQHFDKINNCVIGAEPHHPIMKFCVDHTQERVEEVKAKIGFNPNDRRIVRPSKAEWIYGMEAVGPFLLNDAVEGEAPDCIREPKESFCPVRYKDSQKNQFNTFPDSYALHLWNSAKKDTDWIEIHKTLPCYLRAQK